MQIDLAALPGRYSVIPLPIQLPRDLHAVGKHYKEIDIRPGCELTTGKRPVGHDTKQIGPAAIADRRHGFRGRPETGSARCGQRPAAPFIERRTGSRSFVPQRSVQPRIKPQEKRARRSQPRLALSRPLRRSDTRHHE